MKDFSKVFRLGITDNQLNEFINTVIGIVDTKTMNDILSKLDNNVTTVYNGALNPIKNKQILSHNKFKGKFSRLLSNLRGYIAELGDEDGSYCDSEDSWSHHEFDEFSFSFDIEQVFEKMLPLLDDAYKYKSIEEDYFIALIEKIKNGIDSYPEWTGAEDSDWEIEKNGAVVILKWLWLNKKSISDFIEKAYEIIMNKNITCKFDPVFIHKLTDNEKENLYHAIEKKKTEWKSELEDTNHFLHIIYHIVSQVGNKERFIKESIDRIAEKWHYGIDVYKYYLSNDNYLNAEKYIRLTICEFYSQSGYGTVNVNIEQTILPLHTTGTDERIEEAFKNWLIVLEKINDKEKYKLVTVQYQVYLNPNDYSKFLDIVIENKTRFYDNYISEVKSSFILNSLSRNTSSAKINCWLEYLIDFAIDNNENIFIEKTKEWLSDHFSKSENVYRHSIDYELLMILTSDLLLSLKFKKKYPTFYKHIENNRKSAFSYMQDDLDKIEKFRKGVLKNIKIKTLENSILNVWTSNVHKFIPCPSDVYKARYASHAKWLAIAKEINQDTYSEIYINWRINYYRKINLWRELAGYGIEKTQ